MKGPVFCCFFWANAFCALYNFAGLQDAAAQGLQCLETGAARSLGYATLVSVFGLASLAATFLRLQSALRSLDQTEELGRASLLDFQLSLSGSEKQELERVLSSLQDKLETLEREINTKKREEEKKKNELASILNNQQRATPQNVP